MKKLIAWLSKGTKIVKIIQQIYKALVIASSTVSTGETVANQTGLVPENTAEKISAVKGYIDLALEYLGKIMEWLGISAEEREAFKRSLLADAPTARETPEQIKAEIAKIVEG